MTEMSSSAYDEFIIESAEQYLQTVVLIDDRIYENKRGSVASRLTKPPAVSRTAASKSATADKHGKETEKTEITEELDEVSFHDIQNSFAKKRIICSLYQPRKEASFSEQSEVYKLCSAADVIIVDWDLHGDLGEKATTLVGSVVDQSRAITPHQLQLVVIYTLESNLQSVANKIYVKLVELLGEEEVDVDAASNGLIVTTENSRVVVLGKRENATLTQFSGHWVPESDLAARVIKEFSQLACGLLQGIVLRGFAHLRENNRRILTRFHKNLDVAFLTHRALSLPEETLDQIIPLLTDELRAVLEDMPGKSPLGTSSAVKEILDDWCDKHWERNEDADLKTNDGPAGTKLAKDIFCNGPLICEVHPAAIQDQVASLIKTGDGSPEWKNNRGRKKIAEYLTGNCEVDHCHEKLSSLMSQRVRYDRSRRELRLGVIVRELAGEKRYLLCLQPLCDSVRMEGKGREFLFCVLDEPSENKPLTHSVLDASDNVIQLRYKPKVSNVFVSNFTGNDDAVYANKDQDRFIFKGKGKKNYEWIAELKTEHAQRAAEEFGRELSRVGLTESEWLRIKAKP